ncbi:MAG: DUF2108 domain-containing protein [Methanolinea sp.]|nr:DUF2108 domain-containing protein [Methanolinea sp.]
MNPALALMLSFLVVLGCILVLREEDPYRKIIALSLVVAGAIPFVVGRGLLDVAIAVSLVFPLSTIFILMACPGGEG